MADFGHYELRYTELHHTAARQFHSVVCPLREAGIGFGNTMDIRIGSRLHFCFHEAGHVEAAHLWGATVQQVALPFGGDPHSSIIHKEDLSTKEPVACGGYAVESILFSAGRLVDHLGQPLSEQAFKKQAMQNARLDKRPFYLKQPVDASGLYPGSPFQPNKDWTWPLESDDPFIAYADAHISPVLLQRFSIIEALAYELEKTGRLTQERIGLIRGMKEGGGTSSEAKPD
jgi:hypothetical protein